MIKKAVLITGAGSGIGAATALEFSQQGYFVYLLGRNKEKLQNIAVDCKHGASVIGCDISDPNQVDKKIKEVLAVKVHRIEVLVNNAGIFERHSTTEGNDELWLNQFQVNLMGPIRITRLFIPYFEQLGGGSIVNVSSTLGMRPAPMVSAYSAVKAAMINWTQSLALELGQKNIRANCVCPGIVDTPIHAFHSFEQNQKSQALDGMKNLQPLGRIGNSQEIAKSIYFLASENSAWTTGAVLAVDGGINLT